MTLTGGKPLVQDEPRSARTAKVSFPIVGMGASAGGLEALEAFFREMPSDSGMAFVVVTHLAPDQTSLLPELLQRRTRMQVLEAVDGARIQPNHAYVTPPKKRLTILNRRIQLVAPAEPHGLQLPIDTFFRSLSEDQQERAIGIILSGTGTDGALGVKTIKGGSGMVMVQEPQSAKFSGMPDAAIATGLVDYVLPPSEMPSRLIKYAKGPYLKGAGLPEPIDAPLPAATREILALLRARTGHDFSHYKPSTMRRRIDRRMNVHHIESAEHYTRYLQENPHEIDLLFRELLIGVTSFFRDPDAFEALARTGLPELLASRPDDHTLRVWVPGCSTGEEAYSIAIALRECMDTLGRHLQFQLFATDLDSHAIEVARNGIYPDGIAADVSRQRLRRFFTKQDARYRIKKDVREAVVFASQNVIKDPPFTKLDLISCRNLLIYLDSDLQKRLVPMFHYALTPGGILLLGTSESIGGFSDLFSTIERKWKFYRRKESPASSRAAVGLAGRIPPEAAGSVVSEEHDRRPLRATASDLAEKLLVQEYAPPSVIINERGEIFHIHGRTGTYLEPAPGQPSLNVFDMAREGVRLELASAVRRAITRDGEVVVKAARVKTNDNEVSANLIVKKINDPESLRGLLMVTFEEVGAPNRRPRRKAKGASSKPLRGRTARLEQELQQMRESHQHTVEELRSTNEELQSTNEELQSTNEELETSKEEMHSLNEELQTVNQELQSKLEALELANNDMKNLLNSTDIATIFLDNDLNIKRFTDQAREVVRLIPSDVGRSIGDLASNLDYDALIEDAEKVLRTLAMTEVEVRTSKGRWYLMRIMPYRTVDNVIDGLVLTFVDITGLKEADAALKEANEGLQRDMAERERAELAALEARQYAESIVDAVHEPLLVLDEDLRAVSANRSFFAAFHTTPEQTLGESVYGLGTGQWDVPELRRLLEEILPQDTSFEGFEVRHDFPAIGSRTMRLNARRIERETGKKQMILLAMEDVTGRE
ncbi:MAG: PAS domain-containing protein [Phycisphaerae bacterium]|nr:PAS domain-containing protein [Phycisphaerae bacterium]